MSLFGGNILLKWVLFLFYLLWADFINFEIIFKTYSRLIFNESFTITIDNDQYKLTQLTTKCSINCDSSPAKNIKI